MSAIDFQALVDEAKLTGMERRDVIERMAKDPRRFTTEEVSKRRARVDVLRQTFAVLDALAACPDAQSIILNHLAEKERSNAA